MKIMVSRCGRPAGHRRFLVGLLCAAPLLAACTAGSDSGMGSTSTSSGSADGGTVAGSTVVSTPSVTDTVTTTATASAAPTTTASSDPGPILCTPTVSTFALTPSEGAAGTSYFTVRVTNASQQPCVTTGYPGVALLNAAGSQILQAQRVSGGRPLDTITLAPGDVVDAQIGASTMGPNGSACSTVSPAFLFTLPDNTDSTRLVRDVLACSVTVGPFATAASS